MNALPLAERELRAASKRASTYWSRFGFAFVGAAAGAVMLYVAEQAGPLSASGVLVRTWSLFLFVFLLVRGVKLTADCLSEERREGTLGLLFLTGLKAHGVIWAKLLPPLIYCLCVVAASVPVLVISVLIGGIRAVEFARIAVALLVTILLGLSIGVAISAFGRERRKSESTAAIIAVLLWFFLPLLDQMMQRARPPLSRLFPISLLSPAFLHQTAVGPAIGSGPGQFWAAVLGNLVVIALFQAIAVWKLSSSWQDEVFGLKRRWRDLWLETWRQRGLGNAQARSSLRAQLLNVNAFYWLIARERWRAVRVWGMLGLCAGGAALAAGLAGSQAGFLQLWLFLVLAMWYLALRLLLVDEASRGFMSQRSSGALEMLLATPLTVADLMKGQWLALRRRFAAPVLLFCGLCLLGMALANSSSMPRLLGIEPPELSSILLAMVFLSIADMTALGWVAMWLSLKCRRQADVSGSTIARILLLPNLGWLFCLIFLRGFTPGSGFKWSLSLWFAFGVLVDLFYTLWSRWRLTRDFRRFATREYVDRRPSGAWGRWLGARYAHWAQRLGARFPASPGALRLLLGLCLALSLFGMSQNTDALDWAQPVPVRFYRPSHRTDTRINLPGNSGRPAHLATTPRLPPGPAPTTGCRAPNRPST